MRKSFVALLIAVALCLSACTGNSSTHAPRVSSAPTAKRSTSPVPDASSSSAVLVSVITSASVSTTSLPSVSGHVTNECNTSTLQGGYILKTEGLSQDGGTSSITLTAPTGKVIVNGTIKNMAGVVTLRLSCDMSGFPTGKYQLEMKDDHEAYAIYSLTVGQVAMANKIDGAFA